MSAAPVKWSEPYFGVQHTQRDSRGRYCTVTACESFAQLFAWYPGCGFSPMEKAFGSAEAARAAGERWLAEGGEL